MGPSSGRRPYYDSTGNGRDRQEKFGLGRLVACTSTVWPVTLSDSEARVLAAKWSWAKPPDSVRLRERLSKIQEGYRKRQLLAQHKSRLRQGAGRFPETARRNRRPSPQPPPLSPRRCLSSREGGRASPSCSD